MKEKWYRDIKHEILDEMHQKKINLSYFAEIIEIPLEILEHFFRENDPDFIFYIQLLDIMKHQ